MPGLSYISTNRPAAIALLLVLSACDKPADLPEVVQVEDGIKTDLEALELDRFDDSVRPQDDFYQYVNGSWLAETTIPPDKSNFGSFNLITEKTQRHLHDLLEDVSKDHSAAAGSNQQKLRDFYNSYIDMETKSDLGLEPIQAELDAINQAESHDDIIRLFAQLAVIGVKTPFIASIDPDLNNTKVYAVYLEEGSLSLPSRDYYLADDIEYAHGRTLFIQYAADLLALVMDGKTIDEADKVLKLETSLAEHFWTRSDKRNPQKLNNPAAAEKLPELYPQLNLSLFLKEGPIPTRTQYIVAQPSFFSAMDSLFTETTVEVWKNYLTFQTLNTFAPDMNEKSFAIWFRFERAGLQGIPQPRPVWKRAIRAVDANLGFLLGELYVEQYFPPKAKEEISILVENLFKGFEEALQQSDWMDESTQSVAAQKLQRLTARIAYPEIWPDFSALEITTGALIANIKAARRFESARLLSHIDQPVNPVEWQIKPQELSAGYDILLNSISFPAAILQPPYFDFEGDKASNYGAIGAIIAHEMSHGFDEQGSYFDGAGNIRNWWPIRDRLQFDTLREKLAQQYNAVKLPEGLNIDGEFTSAENIGDLGGIGVAHKAYKISLNQQQDSLIEGLSGDQRFFIAYARVWRQLYREEELEQRLKIDPRAPAKSRVNVVLSNLPAFYQAFDVQPGDSMYRPPEDRVNIW
jgi:putative endopeptidase